MEDRLAKIRAWIQQKDDELLAPASAEEEELSLHLEEPPPPMPWPFTFDRRALLKYLEP